MTDNLVALYNTRTRGVRFWKGEVTEDVKNAVPEGTILVNINPGGIFRIGTSITEPRRVPFGWLITYVGSEDGEVRAVFCNTSVLSDALAATPVSGEIVWTQAIFEKDIKNGTPFFISI